MGKLILKISFGVVPTSLLNDNDISLKAKGLFAYIQSKPENWNFSAERISLQTKDGLDSVRSAIKELEYFGYLQRVKSRNNKGYIDVDYVLNAERTSIKNPKAEEPTLVFPVLENPTLENPTLENPTYISNNIYTKIELEKKEKRKKEIDYNEIIGIFNSLCVDLPSVTKLTDKRKRAIDLIAKEYSLIEIGDVLKKVVESDFLSGRSGSWSATFDWIFGKNNFIKILEDNYKNKNNGRIEKSAREVFEHAIQSEAAKNFRFS